MYTYEEAYKSTLQYFNGAELPTKIYLDKYALRNKENELVEKDPSDTHKRLASEFARIEKKKFGDQAYSYEFIYDLFKDFKYIIPQGSPLYGIGNKEQYVTISNCYVVEPPEDSYAGILRADQHLVQISKRRGGVGIDLDNLRPENSPTRNSSRTSTGVVSWSKRYSHSIREVGQCLIYNSLVLTNNGLKEIRNVIPNKDKVWTLKGWINVTNTVYTGTNSVYKVTTKKGFSCVSTLNHVYMDKNNKEIKLENLKIGDEIVLIPGKSPSFDVIRLLDINYQSKQPKSLNNINNISIPKELNKDLAYLLGYSYGDGHFVLDNSKAISLCLSCNDEEIIKRLSNIIKNQFNYIPKINKGSGNVKIITINSVKLCHWLQHNNLAKEKSDDIKMPNAIINSPGLVQLSFFAGYFDADGHAHKTGKNVRVTSISKNFIEKCQTILMANGIVTNIQLKISKFKNEKPEYRLNISGKHSQNVARELINSIKLNRMLRTSKQEHNITPFLYKDISFKAKNIRKQYSFVPTSLKQNLSLEALYKLKTYKEFESELSITDEISTIEYVGKKETYDLQLESEHLFWCEGFYVHNSGRRGALMLTLSVHHPDILSFITMKNDDVSVTGANISVKLTDEFLNAVKADEEYETRWPVNSPNPTIKIQLNARRVWEMIYGSAHLRAEPGLLFWDNILRESPADCYAKFGFNTVSTNPCCFSERENVWVITNNGIKDIKNITNNDKVWINETQTWESTSGYFNAGQAEVYKVSFKNGDSVIVTENHKFATITSNRISTKIIYKEGELKKLSDLKIGDKIAIHTSQPTGINFGHLGSYEEGLILGWLTGDGCLSYLDDNAKYPATILDFWPKEFDTGEICLDALKKLGYKLSLVTNTSNNTKRIKTEKFSEDFTNKYNYNIWLFKSEDKYNQFLFDCSKEFIIGFMQTYFAADGTVQYDTTNKNYNIQLSSINKNRLIQIRCLLNLFGIKSAIDLGSEAGESNFKNCGKYKTKDCWRLTITGIENIQKFHKEIGIINKNKTDKLTEISKLIGCHTNKCKNYTQIINIEYIGKDNVGCIDVNNSHKFTANTIISGNSELPLCANDSCRLMALVLLAFVEHPFTKKAYFNFKKFYEYAQYGQRLMDDMIDLEIECITRILDKIVSDPESSELKQTEYDLWYDIREKCIKGRRTGLGILALGDTLAALGIKYGSKDSIKVVDKIYNTLKFGAYKASVDLAKKFGPFEIFDNELEKDCPFFQRFDGQTVELEAGTTIYGRTLLDEMKKHGRRNIALLTTAPTGTIANIAMLEVNGVRRFGTTSGIEPLFDKTYTRRKKGNPGDKDFRVDFTDKNGDSWMHFDVDHTGIQAWKELHGNKESPYDGAVADEIDWVNRVKLQAAAQKHIDHGISSTINLPEDVTKEKVAEIYTAAWEAGLKGITVYRKNSRSGVLIEKVKGVPKHDAPERPKSLECDVHHITVKGKSYFILIGMYENDPYEIFAGRNGMLDNSIKRGTITKVRKNFYKAVLDDGTELSPVTLGCDEHEETITRLASIGLRHGAPVHFIIEQLQKVGGDLNGYAKSIARALKHYIKDKTLSAEKCECGSDLVYQSGCITCQSCGYSKCS